LYAPFKKGIFLCGSHFDDIDFALEALDNLIFNGGVGYGLYDATNDIDPCSTSGIRIYIVDPFGGFLNVGNNDGGIG